MSQLYICVLHVACGRRWYTITVEFHSGAHSTRSIVVHNKITLVIKYYSHSMMVIHHVHSQLALERQFLQNLTSTSCLWRHSQLTRARRDALCTISRGTFYRGSTGGSYSSEWGQRAERILLFQVSMLLEWKRLL